MVTNSDKELGQTHTVKMKIDTGDHPPIMLRPYRTHIHKRPLVEEAVRDMLETGMTKIEVSLELSYSGGRQKRWRAQILCRIQETERCFQPISGALAID